MRYLQVGAYKFSEVINEPKLCMGICFSSVNDNLKPRLLPQKRLVLIQMINCFPQVPPLAGRTGQKNFKVQTEKKFDL